MTREQAGERFGVTYGLGLMWSLLTQVLDMPAPIRLGVGVVVLGVLAYYGTKWLRLAARDGTIRRGLPDYGWAFLSLLIIAAAWALVTVPILLIAGEALTATAVSTGAFLGVCATLSAWWAVKGRRARAEGR